MTALAVRLAQATTSTTFGGPDGGPGGRMRGGPGGPGGLMSGGPKGGMRGAPEQIGRHMERGDDPHWIMLVLVGVVALVLIGLAVWAIIAFSRAAKARTEVAAGGTTGPSAKELLDQRLAKGEIEPEDYEARRKLLDS